MHLTNVLPSDKVAKGQAYIPASPLGGEINLDLKGDKKISDITELLNKAITKNGWDVKNNEKQIVNTMLEIMHRPEFLGPYDKKKSDGLDKVKELQKEFKSVLADKSLGEEERWGKAREINAEADKILKASNNSVGKTKDMKDGAICPVHAAYASKILHDVGIPNNYCAGMTQDGTSHVYVQLTGSNAVVEATGNNGYLKCINNKSIADSEVAMVINDAKGVYCYGTGELKGWFSERNFSREKAVEAIDKNVRDAKDEYKKANGNKKTADVEHGQKENFDKLLEQYNESLGKPSSSKPTELAALQDKSNQRSV